MVAQTISLEEIASRVFEIRQKVRDEITPKGNQEIEEYKRTHEEPTKPFWPFGEKRRQYNQTIKECEQGLETIRQKYQNHPLTQEWAELQKKCPHNYGQWEEIDGPSEIRTCSVCYHKQHRWNFPDPIM